MNVQEKPHISELIQTAWVSPDGVIIPDYAYPIVEYAHQLNEQAKEKLRSDAADNEKSKYDEGYFLENFALPKSVISETLKLLSDRLTYLNDGVPTSSLAVLPKEEYALFKEKGVTVLTQVQGKPGSGLEEESIQKREKPVLVLLELFKEMLSKVEPGTIVYSQEVSSEIEVLEKRFRFWKKMQAFAHPATVVGLSAAVGGGTSAITLITNPNLAFLGLLSGFVFFIGGAVSSIQVAEKRFFKAKNEKTGYVEQIENEVKKTVQDKLIKSYLTHNAYRVTGGEQWKTEND